MLYVLGDLNKGVGDWMRAGKTGRFSVLGENNNGRRVIDFMLKRGFVRLLDTSSTRVGISTSG